MCAHCWRSCKNQNTPLPTEATTWHNLCAFIRPTPLSIIHWRACPGGTSWLTASLCSTRGGTLLTGGTCLRCPMGRSSSGAPAASEWCPRTAPFTALSPSTSRSGSRIKRWGEAGGNMSKLREKREAGQAVKQSYSGGYFQSKSTVCELKIIQQHFVK